MSDRVFFVSDTHFGHANILKYDRRPFASVEEHDAELIRRWNAVVGEQDRVFHLGDLAFYRDAARVSAVVAQLNGRKHLLLGNHDRDPVRRSAGWEWIREPYHELRVMLPDGGRQKIVLCHYPLATWNGAHRGSWHLHGHCHGNLSLPPTTRLDMGVNLWDYAPVSLAQVADAMADRTYDPVDQHGRPGVPDD